MASQLFLTGLVPFLVSLLACIAIVLTQRHHGHLTTDGQGGVQKLHSRPTPRVGGVGIALAAGTGGLLLAPEAQALWWPICLTVIPAFAAGLIEDVTKRVSARERLIATVLSGLLFVLWTGYSISGVDLPWIDSVLQFGLVATVFTAVAIGGIANAINIIDGVNGLSSGTVMICLGVLGYIAFAQGDMALVACIVLCIAAVAGFFLVNFPFGRLFLGDAGAYSLGFLLAVFAVALPQRNPEVSPLIGLIVLIYPVTETLVSVWRRMVRVGSHPGRPDRLHLHSLVFRSQARVAARRLGLPGLRNAMAAVLVFSMPLLSGFFALLSYRDPLLILAGIAMAVLAYLTFYRRVALLEPTLTDRFLRGLKPQNV
ncbi:MraY family glycosyltransferase [Rhodobacter ferrooxidans]|uniref:Glycosyl transferase family 4 n=1 Tax=Rhodobacter ferrooxidans TaxID=371731 RepID=C8S392_9RHOB|nr:glycosyltransferase [Rhodobacter sp. SW2]EEW24574.1 glycosyl transferase family 4 [Rhodobacter sp. SW2]